MTRDELIEAMALAIFNDGHSPEYGDTDGQSMEYCRDFAKAALSAIEAQGLAIVDRAKLTAVLDTACLDYDATPADRERIGEIQTELNKLVWI